MIVYRDKGPPDMTRPPKAEYKSGNNNLRLQIKAACALPPMITV